ncbi:MAG: hypothetical protein WCR52_16380 [Bacteroidota bacterium]
MSKFDRIFADKLNEEQQFPGQDQNWNKLTGMLGAHDLMLYGLSKGLRMWKAIAAASITTVVGLGILTYHLKDQNKALQAALQQQQTTFQTIQAEMVQLQAAISSNKQENFANQSSPQNLPLRHQEINNGSNHTINAIAQNATFDKTNTPTYIATPTATNGVSGLSKNEPTTQPANAGAENVAAATNVANTGNDHLVNAGQQSSEEFYKENPVAAQEALAQLQNIVDSFNVAKKAELIAEQNKRVPVCAFLPSGLQAPKLQMPELPALADASAKTPMVRTLHRHDRVRAGVQTLLGTTIPKEKGVSLVMGNGITAEVSPIRDLWITASADWSHFDISTDTVVRRFHFPDPPGPPSHQMDKQLVHIDASPRQQQYTLGLRYRFPTRSWVRPSVRIAHVWTRVTPGVITYRFEDDHVDPGPNPHPHDPEYLVQKTDAQFYGNTWKAGLGLEHETKRWVFGVYADYGRKNSYQHFSAQAGIQYRFD